ncbi:metalloendoproteinase 4-MMP-like [Andrographis paniculata]|uniref:metalloendoproteinase 4-MMP-like n=1 Tax=Andrographis paniculata TaxID=175694 RepID=UPI0021E84244|nr:metalloendoproteinase 4-MMP-like [Andrographis paniculata]
MFPFFRYVRRPLSLFIFLAALPLSPAIDSPPDVHPNNTWSLFARFLDAEKGSRVDGMAELKRYLSRFGYLPVATKKIGFDDFFDEELEKALILYQENLGLSETGKLDHETMRAIVKPRCGVRDFKAGGKRLKAARKFAYFVGDPVWMRSPPFLLTYAVSPANTIDYVSLSEVRKAFRRAFASWSAAIPVNFTEAEDYAYADIRIGWFHGDHGDGEAFDGVLGVLGHAFAPESGRLHLDAAERWAVNFDADYSDVAVDLESVATHEIGHVLGLAHSSVKDSIMYPSLSPRTKKLGLRKDDVDGIQSLYGSNPNYRYNSQFESDMSSGRASRLQMMPPLMALNALISIAIFIYFF